VRIADVEERNFVPTASERIPRIIEVAGCAGLGETDNRNVLILRWRGTIANMRHEFSKTCASGLQDLGYALRARPSLLPIARFSLAFVERCRIQTCPASETRRRKPMITGQSVDRGPDI
jgi:hypothetical protein